MHFVSSIPSVESLCCCFGSCAFLGSVVHGGFLNTRVLLEPLNLGNRINAIAYFLKLF